MHLFFTQLELGVYEDQINQVTSLVSLIIIVKNSWNVHIYYLLYHSSVIIEEASKLAFEDLVLFQAPPIKKLPSLHNCKIENYSPYFA